MQGRKSPDRLTLLDGLRGLAAFAVVLWHYRFFFLMDPAHPPIAGWDELQPGRPFLNLGYDAGFRAVELFWVISGFVFAHVYASRPGTSTQSFFANRFARLYPLHFVTLIAVAILQFTALEKFGDYLIFHHNDGYHFALQLFMASGWGVQNGPSYNDVVWSVSVELLVYAAFWALRRRLLEVSAIPALLLSVCCGMVVLLGPPTFAFACGFYFFAGVALERTRANISGNVAKVSLLIAGMLAVSIACWWSGVELLKVSIGLAALYGAVVVATAELDSMAHGFAGRAAEVLGNMSFGIYLWHIPVMLLLMISIEDPEHLARAALNGWFLAAYVGLVALVAYCGYRFIEAPLRVRLREGLSGERRAANAAAVITTAG